MEGEAPAWELSKENAMPLRRGRDVKRFEFNEHGKKDRLSKEQLTHENALNDALSKTSTLEDPLKVWVKYIRWMQDNFESGNSELLSLYERCAREFTEDHRYKNNEMYLKIWIGYADLLDNPTKVFKFLRTNGIGENLALLYVATAWTAEHRHDFPLADKAYSVGLEKGAAPVELLQKRHREFQRRMSRRWLNQAEKEKNGEEEDQEVEAGSRSFRAINATDAARLHRPLAVSSNPQQSQGVGGGSNVRKSGLEFNVFMDKKISSRKDDWGNDENPSAKPGWRAFAPEIEQSKENSQAPAPWTDQGFSRSSRQSPMHGAQKELPFGVFVDEQRDEEKRTSEACNLKERSKDNSELESLYKEPLRNFGKGMPTTRPHVDDGASQTTMKHDSPETPPRRKTQQDDVTINTRMALNDMLEMFSSPVSSPSLNSSRESAAAPPVAAFSIFNETADENDQENVDENNVSAVRRSNVVDEKRVFRELEAFGIDDEIDALLSEEYEIPRGFQDEPQADDNRDEGFVIFEDVPSRDMLFSDDSAFKPLESILEVASETESSFHKQPTNFAIFQD